MKLITTSQLYSSPSFFRGVARSIDLFGTINQYNESKSESEADYVAIKRDWNVVGQMLSQVLFSYAKDSKKYKKAK